MFHYTLWLLRRAAYQQPHLSEAFGRKEQPAAARKARRTETKRAEARLTQPKSRARRSYLGMQVRISHWIGSARLTSL